MPHTARTAQRISGPHNGYHVALYACPPDAPGKGYVGFFKICARRPAGYFGADGLLRGCGAEQPTQEAALQAAEAQARLMARLLPPADGTPWPGRLKTLMMGLVHRSGDDRHHAAH